MGKRREESKKENCTVPEPNIRNVFTLSSVCSLRVYIIRINQKNNISGNVSV